MAAVMRVRIGCITKRLVQVSFTSPCLRDKCVSHFHRSSFLGVTGQELKMPSLSPTMSEGTIVKWLKKEGDTIAAGDVICDIQTDKAVVSFEVEEEGILAKILVPENIPDIKVGTLIALMVSDGEDWQKVEMSASAASGSSSAPSSGSSGSGPKPVAVPGASFPTSTLMSYGPAVRNLLERYDLKANVITPTGYRNKLLKEDVLKYIQSNKLTEKPVKTAPPPTKPTLRKAPAAAAAAATAPAPAPAPATAPAPAPVQDPQKSAKAPVKQVASGFVDIELSNMRKTIAKRLSESKSRIPHSYATVVSDITKVISQRKKLKEEGIGVSVNDFVVKAAACALQMFPEVNAHWIKDQLVPVHNIDISIAVATDSGLITPIVFDVPGKGLVEISSTIKDLATRARQGKLKPQEFQGGSFTISNLGMFGVKEFSAIINPPQCAILAVGGGQSILNEELKLQTNMHATLSYDRRAFDEGIAAEFLKAFQSMLESPAMMMLGRSSDLRQKLEA